jgi:hypothetical protein
MGNEEMDQDELKIVDEFELLKIMHTDPYKLIQKLDDKSALRPHNPLFRPLAIIIIIIL